MANQKEAANSARAIVDFVQSTLDMISINLQDSDKEAKAFEKAVGGGLFIQLPNNNN